MDLCLQAALKYREWGWSSIAACNPKHLYVGLEHSRICKSPGKVPANLKWKYWQDHLPDKKEIENQFRFFPNSNVCVVTGKVSNLVGIDIDGNLEELKEKLPWLILPKTISFKTGRGYRFLYELKGIEVKSTSIRVEGVGGIDILSDGKQTIMPPSLHHSGVLYEWIPNEKTLAPFLPFKIDSNKEKYPCHSKTEYSKVISEGERNTRLFKAACGARRHGAEEQDLFALLKSMNTRCEPQLKENDLHIISQSASKYKPSW